MTLSKIFCKLALHAWKETPSSTSELVPITEPRADLVARYVRTREEICARAGCRHAREVRAVFDGDAVGLKEVSGWKPRRPTELERFDGTVRTKLYGLFHEADIEKDKGLTAAWRAGFPANWKWARDCMPNVSVWVPFKKAIPYNPQDNTVTVAGHAGLPQKAGYTDIRRLSGVEQFLDRAEKIGWDVAMAYSVKFVDDYLPRRSTTILDIPYQPGKEAGLFTKTVDILSRREAQLDPLKQWGPGYEGIANLIKDDYARRDHAERAHRATGLSLELIPEMNFNSSKYPRP